MNELLNAGQPIAIFAIFSVLILDKVLNFVGKKKTDESCKFPGTSYYSGSMEQLKKLYEDGIRSNKSWEHMTEAINRLISSLDRQNATLDRQSSTLDRQSEILHALLAKVDNHR